MYDYIKGTVEYIAEDYIVIENHGVGYKVMTSSFTMADLNGMDGEVIVYTQLIVREDDMSICGFSSRHELTMFRLLTSVSGIGTKVALAVLSSIGVYDLAAVIASGDVNKLVKAPGVGKKTAQRVILELKDKIDKKLKVDAFPVGEIRMPQPVAVTSSTREALEALIALGYSSDEAEGVLARIDSADKNTEAIVKEALRLIMAG